MIEAVSHGGKKIQLVLDKRHAAYKFQFNPGGELPEDLSGLFMDERNAKIALARYLDRTKPKKNAER
jgi:hypothetical protein